MVCNVAFSGSGKRYRESGAILRDDAFGLWLAAQNHYYLVVMTKVNQIF